MFARSIQNANAVSVNLFRGDERSVTDPIGVSHFPMNMIEPRQDLRLVMRHVDVGNARRKTVNDSGQSA